MTDQEYIKMILALDEEFFEVWEWKETDKVIFIGSLGLNNVCVLKVDGVKLWIYDYEVRIFDPKLIGFDLANIPMSDKRLRPIPNQEQLQKMIKNHMLKDDETVLDYDIINFFCDWFKAHFCSKSTYKEIEHGSIKSVWLRYAMHIIYSKRWNGVSWEKDE